MSYSLECTDLHKDFSGERALDGVGLAVDSGTLFGLIGADGAGKTTLMRVLATLISADAGKASVLGLDVSVESQRIRSSIGYMPQRFSLYEDLSVRENMLFFADIFGVSGADRRARIERLLEFSRLGPFQDRRARNLSGGMKQKLALSCALIHTPTLLILDEPTTGVDPVSRKEFWAILRDLRAQGITILVSTPYMDEAEFCDSLALLHRGRVIAAGAPSELIKHYPLHLYEATGDGGALSVSGSVKLPASISLAYPAGGSLRVASTLAPNAAPEILDDLKRLVPGAKTLTPANPTTEDLFFYHLSTIGTAAEPAGPAPKKGRH